MDGRYALMVHGGAGHISNADAYRAGLTRAIEAGKIVLDSGGTALDAVVASTAALEDDPVFNAGKGSVLNESGNVEMDASVMDGKALMAGAVAGVHNIKNPIRMARAVMEHSEHVMLIGEGAMKFAAEQGVEHMPDDYFITDARKEQLVAAKQQGKIVLDHGDVLAEKKFGTVGAVARDTMGNLAAATSTGGVVNKKYGRIGDTPVIGAGTYADNQTCAVSATGYGEQFLRTVLAKTIADIRHYEKCSAQDAADKGIAYLVEKVHGLGGVIVIDGEGGIGSAYSTPGFAQ